MTRSFHSAIGKKGQNVRLGGEALGWKVDIKTKRKNGRKWKRPLSALVPTGAPVSILIDHGWPKTSAEKAD